MSKMSDLIKGFRYNVKQGYQTTLIHTNSVVHLTCENPKGYVGLTHLTDSIVHTQVMIYEDPITQLKPEGKATLLHKIGDLPDGLERWKVCFDGEDGEVYERTIKTR